LQSQSTVGSQQHDSSYLGAEIALYDFRKRDKSKDLHHEWANPNRLLSEADRIETAERDAKAAFLRNPTFPKEGGSVKNAEFSFMSNTYNYRQREPSKEIAGSVSILRVKPRTESERVNATVKDEGMRDVLAGGIWTLDNKYGNPPANVPLPIGSPFRQPATERQLSPSRGGFSATFRSTKSASIDRYDNGERWLHHREEFVDTAHNKVAASLRSEQRKLGRTASSLEEEKREAAFSAYLPPNVVNVSKDNLYIPNPSALCSWNVAAQGKLPQSPSTQKMYRKASHIGLQ